MKRETEFELFACRVYQKLANARALSSVDVKHNVKLVGKSGCEHQIDVYFEYVHEGRKNAIVIECKNYSKLVPIGKVRDFYGVLHDLGNASGIMVSSKGFQKGAIKFGDFYGISLKTLRAPERNESIGSIVIVNHVRQRLFLFLIDEGWAADSGFNVKEYRNRLTSLSLNKSEFFLTSPHLPFELVDVIIRDSFGKKLESISNLEKQLPIDSPENGCKVFRYDDAYINTRYFGAVKIREVKFEWASDETETAINMAADSFVDGIIKDVISGSEECISKY